MKIITIIPHPNVNHKISANAFRTYVGRRTIRIDRQWSEYANPVYYTLCPDVSKNILNNGISNWIETIVLHSATAAVIAATCFNTKFKDQGIKVVL